ncbi:fibulin-2-like protein, partial [Lates japonicus]
MAYLIRAEVALLRCTLLFFYLSVSLCQRDCTSVDCPLLDNCIEEVLETGSCCTSCLQKGCTCEGYQYYDCVNVGFKNGKVPEGDSYFVDYGSTECSCPVGGGRISCHFISCPDMSPNCIEVSEPADGCAQCERIGCVHGGQKYEAGHSFHIDPCFVCHCPNEGGKLMCYPFPDCDPKKIHKPMLAAPTEEDTASRHDSYPYRFDQQGHTDQISTPHRDENLPLFESLPLDKEEPEDYDYGPTDLPETYPQSLVFPTQSSSSNKSISVSRGSEIQSFDKHSKLELRERYGVHDHPIDREEVTENPLREDQVYTQRTPESSVHPQASSNDQKELQGTVAPDSEEGVDAGVMEEDEEEKEEIVTFQSVTEPEGKYVPYMMKSSQQEKSNEQSKSNNSTSSYKKTTPEHSTSSPRGHEYHTTPMVHFIKTTTTQLPVKLDESQPSRKPGQRLFNLHSEDREKVNEEGMEDKDRPVLLIKPGEGPSIPAEGLLQSCCAAGQRWATENHHCNNMPLLNNDKQSTCNVVQMHCCLNLVKESQCEFGMTSAREGDTCEVDQEDQCTDGSHQVCCSCCALGFYRQWSEMGLRAHQYLDYPCSHVFSHLLRGRKIRVRSAEEKAETSINCCTWKVSYGKYPKEAFSVSAIDEAVNAVEKQEVVDECQLYAGQLCQHTCTSVGGSYHCECHHGYILQQDRHSCAP